jgi:hypothetical protein
MYRRAWNDPRLAMFEAAGTKNINKETPEMKKILLASTFSMALLAGTALHAQDVGVGVDAGTGGGVSVGSDNGGVSAGGGADAGVGAGVDNDGVGVDADVDAGAAASAESDDATAGADAAADSALDAFFTDETQAEAIGEAEIATTFAGLSAEDQQQVRDECSDAMADQASMSESMTAVCTAVSAM